MSVRGLQNRMFCLARYPLSRTSSRYYIVTTEQVRMVNLLAIIHIHYRSLFYRVIIMRKSTKTFKNKVV